MSNLTLESNPVHLSSSIAGEAQNKTQAASSASTPMPTSNTGKIQGSADVFEQAKTSFFSK